MRKHLCFWEERQISALLYLFEHILSSKVARLTYALPIKWDLKRTFPSLGWNRVHFSHLSEVRSKSKQGNGFQGAHTKISVTPFWSFTGRSFLESSHRASPCKPANPPSSLFLSLGCSFLDQRKLKVTSPGQTTLINTMWIAQLPSKCCPVAKTKATNRKTKTRLCLYENKGVHRKLLFPFLAVFSLFLSNEHKASRLKGKLNCNTATGVEAKRAWNPGLGLW